MPEVTTDIRVYCSCGAELHVGVISISLKVGYFVTVEPCKRCIKRKSYETFDVGFDNGYKISLEDW